MPLTTDRGIRLATLMTAAALLLAVALALGGAAPAAAEPPDPVPDGVPSGAPVDVPDAIPLDKLRSLPAPQIDGVEAAPLGEPGEPGEPTGDGYLFAQVYDLLTGRALGDRTVELYDRHRNLVAQKPITCRGYAEFSNLAYGAYRVALAEDPDWTTWARNGASEWYLVGPYWPVAVRFFVTPDIDSAGLRVYAYSPFSRQAGATREPVVGAAFEVYDTAGNLVTLDVTGCGGFVDFDLAPGTYRVVDANSPSGVANYPPSGERLVTARFGWLTSTWFFTVSGPAPEGTPTPEP